MPCSAEQINRVQKTQAIRTIDVALIGPLMLIGGMELQRRGESLTGGLLSFFAISTIVYNARNWWRVEAALGSERSRR